MSESDEQTRDEDEQPEIDEDEMADFGSVAEEIEDAASPDVDEDDQEESDDVQEESESDADQEDVDEVSSPVAGDVSVGTVYCNGLGMSAAVMRTSFGSADEDQRDALMDEYSSMAEQLEIDECVDQWLEEHGGVDELSPGQAAVVLTGMWMGMVAMDDPDMVSNLAGEVGA